MATKNKGAGRVAWSSEQFNLFVKICVRGTNLGKRNVGGWGDKGYTWLQNELRQVGVEYTKEQLRHKWDWMKDQWKMWKALKGNETGLGWDPIKGTVVAPDEWWNEKIKDNKGKKVSGATQMTDTVKELKETIKETMEFKTATMCSLLGDRPGCSIEEVMKDVLTLPLIEKGSDIHFFCTLLLDQKSKREMYNTLEDAETKWKWLQFHFSLWTNGVWKPST
ncbi:hypothetical protein P3X46_027998 [Hevea brasiliensis]|uniref:Myb/SANT-like domain-containing protein n=1 Tax=Hevea brasiliensis TaxID=3981 RepID=A0ABQ9KML9_HEVBR|nr:hypothetical protein P3X46_027998 [Hevea brasiliensis]